MEAWELALALAGSFVAGYVGSMLGLVLGTLRLPLIVALTGSPLAAAGTNIAISAASAGAGAIRHARERRVDWRVVAWMAPPSVAGAILGALAAGDVSERLLYAAIAAVLVWSGIDLALRPVHARARERLRLWPAVAGGLGIGALGGAVGVILGTLRMPTLVRAVGMDVRRAAGTNLVVGFLLGVAGFATHAGESGVDWPILLAGLAGAIPGGWLGARATGGIDENVLRLALGAVLVVVGVAFAVAGRGLAADERARSPSRAAWWWRLARECERRAGAESLNRGGPARVEIAITRTLGKTARRSETKRTRARPTSTTTTLHVVRSRRRCGRRSDRCPPRDVTRRGMPCLSGLDESRRLSRRRARPRARCGFGLTRASCGADERELDRAADRLRAGARDPRQLVRAGRRICAGRGA